MENKKKTEKFERFDWKKNVKLSKICLDSENYIIFFNKKFFFDLLESIGICKSISKTNED